MQTLPLRAERAVVGTATALAALFFLVQSPAVGQARFEVTFSGGVTHFFGDDPTGMPFGVPDGGIFERRVGSSTPKVERSYALGIATRVRVGHRFGAEASGLWVPTEVSPPDLPRVSGGTDLHVSAYTLSGILYFPRGGSRWEPFVTIGGGARVYDARVTNAYPSWSVGGGIEVPIRESLAARFEARNYMAVTDVADFHRGSNPNPSDRRFQSDLALTVGLTFFDDFD